MTTPLDQLGHVTRAIQDTERNGRPVRALVATQTYDATVDDVWDAVTTAERIPRWFLPVSGDLELGGSYQLEGNAGGTVLACEPPRSYEVTWEMGGEISWVVVTLTATGEGTTLELRHVAHVDDERWTEYGPGAVGVGWEGGLLGLATHLSGAPGVDPSNAAEWMVSDEGKEFMRRSATAWGEAAIAAGDDPDQARAAARRTATAYTGG